MTLEEKKVIKTVLAGLFLYLIFFTPSAVAKKNASRGNRQSKNTQNARQSRSYTGSSEKQAYVGENEQDNGHETILKSYRKNNTSFNKKTQRSAPQKNIRKIYKKPGNQMTTGTANKELFVTTSKPINTTKSNSMYTINTSSRSMTSHNIGSQGSGSDNRSFRISGRTSDHGKSSFSISLNLGSSGKSRSSSHYNRVFKHQPRRRYHQRAWPKSHFNVYYSYNPYFVSSYVYPHYYRNYVFVSLGTYWPLDYQYARYYRYPSHSYVWYGRSPELYEVEGDTNNYYTYNYYGDSSGPGEKLIAAPNIEPQPETTADRYFDRAVEAFEDGNYDRAIDNFGNAGELDSEDVILPFAYVQALFANGQYEEAARVLRSALEGLPADQQGVFYPRGLYADEEILFEQIERLSKRAGYYRFNSDLQLLLGYQLLGADKLDLAGEPLRRAAEDQINEKTATTLLTLLEKLAADKE